MVVHAVPTSTPSLPPRFSPSRAMANSCRLVDKAGGASTTALFTYARLWLFSEQVLMVRQDFLVPVFWPTRMQLALFTFAFLRPSRVALGLCVAMRISMYTAQAPMIWDSSIWANFTDCCFLSSLVLCADADVLRGTGDTVRVMMGMFYVAAGFWKLNSAFLDATVSCGSIYVASLLAYLPPALTPAWLGVPSLWLFFSSRHALPPRRAQLVHHLEHATYRH